MLGVNAREVIRAVWCVHLSVRFYERMRPRESIGKDWMGTYLSSVAIQEDDLADRLIPSR